MTRMLGGFLAAVSLALSGCRADGPSPLSMHVIVLNSSPQPDGGKWNDLLGRPLIAIEYAARRDTGVGGRTLYLYDARSGECRTVVHAPGSPGDPMVIAWAPCK